MLIPSEERLSTTSDAVVGVLLICTVVNCLSVSVRGGFVRHTVYAMRSFTCLPRKRSKFCSRGHHSFPVHKKVGSKALASFVNV